jgi:hypothetical protein
MPGWSERGERGDADRPVSWAAHHRPVQDGSEAGTRAVTWAFRLGWSSAFAESRQGSPATGEPSTATVRRRMLKISGPEIERSASEASCLDATDRRRASESTPAEDERGERARRSRRDIAEHTHRFQRAVRPSVTAGSAALS